MRGGLIGKNINYSYSKVIFEYLYKNILNQEFNYEIINQDIFHIDNSFSFLNVTIPFKNDAIKYCHVLDEASINIGAINLIVNKNNTYYGYNCDYQAFSNMVSDVCFDNKKILIIGSGQTSKMVKYYLRNYKKVDVVSRISDVNKYISYDSLIYNNDYQIIINTTPVGTYPNFDDIIINIKDFKEVECIIDVIYNPNRTKLIDTIKDIKTINGLDMLIYQALDSFEKVNNIKVDKFHFKNIKKLILSNLNIVLIGMPQSGKSTISSNLSNVLKDFTLCDTDEVIRSRYGSISKMFLENGESYFRSKETEIIKEISLKKNLIIATGGGVILNNTNMRYLRSNGIIFYLKRSLEEIDFENNRPLIRSKEDYDKLYEFRKDLYKYYSDYTIENKEIEKTINKIIEKRNDYLEKS